VPGGRTSMSGPFAKDPITHDASADGGRRAFNITTGIVSIGAGTGESLLAALVNPTGSGYDMHLDLGEFGSSTNTTFRRYRNSTLSSLTSPISANNMGGGSATSVAQMYIPPNFARSGGTVSKTAHIAAYQQYFAHIRGRSVLRPGQSLSWTIQQVSGGAFTASVYFEFWEIPAAA